MKPKPHRPRKRITKPKPKAKPAARETLYSVNALSKITGRDRRTLDKVLSSVKPDGKRKSKPVYKLEGVEAALRAYKSESGSLADIKLQIAAETLRKFRLANDRVAGLLVRRSEVAAAMERIYAPIVALIEQKLCNEFPTAVAGLEPAQARVYGIRIFDQIVDAHRSFAHEFDRI